MTQTTTFQKLQWHQNGFVNRTIEIALMFEDESLQVGRFRLKQRELLRLKSVLTQSFHIDSYELMLVDALLCITKLIANHEASFTFDVVFITDRKVKNHFENMKTILSRFQVSHQL